MTFTFTWFSSHFITNIYLCKTFLIASFKILVLTSKVLKKFLSLKFYTYFLCPPFGLGLQVEI